MKLIYRRCNSVNEDFIKLVAKLDKDLAVRDGNEHDFYHQFNAIDQLDYTIVVYLEESALGCGAIKLYSERTAEVKRMYVLDEYRGQRIATKLLSELEEWAVELNFTKLILETGVRNPEAIAVYLRSGYIQIENYDQYSNMENSVCFAKELV